MAAVGIAAVIFESGVLLERLHAGVLIPLSVLPLKFLLGSAINMLVGLPVAVVGGVPIWLIFRYLDIRSTLAFALGGACLALITYLLLVALGMGQPSWQHLTFAENLFRPLHIPRISFALVAGAGGALAFREIAARDPRSPSQVTS